MTLGPIDTAPEEPRPAPPEPDVSPASERLPPGQWVRANLFGNWHNTVLTVIFGGLLAWFVLRAVSFVLFTAEWEIVRRNLTNFMVGRFPRDALARPWIAIFVVSVFSGIGLGVNARRKGPADPRDTLRRVWPALLLVVVLLSLSRTWTPTVLVLLSLGAALLGRALGARLPERAGRYLPLISLAGVIGAFMAFTAFGGAGWGVWGGFLLTLFLAIGGIVLSFPLGVLLALGRRSTFPAVRVVCVAYIELIRGVPLITLLFMGEFVIGLFLPPAFQTPHSVTRALIVLTMFTAAYVAEIVRGGLQSVPEGQVEAAQAIGLSPIKTTRMIVLPQALRNVIPALVGQFISLFKDTSLVFIVGLTELLRVAETITAQPDFVGRGLHTETLLFASFVYWVSCYTMSRSSQRLEQRLGVGER